MSKDGVLAKFSLLRTLPFVTFLLGCCLILLWGTATEGLAGILKNNPGLAIYIVAGWIGLPFTLWLSLSVLFQLLFRGARAVWTDGDSLIYINRVFFKLARKDVASIDVRPAENYTFIKLINFHLSDGKTRLIGTAFLRENREELIPKLRDFVFSSEGDIPSISQRAPSGTV